MAAKKVNITTDDGRSVEATAPIIVSASRSTDIPAFYAEWFFRRLEKGYSVWTNPFNGVPLYISYQNTRFIVFWSKNPRPLLGHLEYLKQRNIGCYIQYTLNDYEDEGLEKGVPPLEQRIDTFIRLVDQLGVGRVVWRFDPMILTDEISIEKLLEKVKNIGDRLKGYTEKLVFSFADISSYKKVKTNLDKNNIRYQEWDEDSMKEFASRLSVMNKERGWNYILATCGEKIEIVQYGIEHNRCVDDDLMIRFAWSDSALMKFLNVDIHTAQPTLFDEPEIPLDAIKISDTVYGFKRKNNRDKGQRQFCGCIISKDIGQYNTCPHQCEYCYANTSKAIAVSNWQQHLSNPLNDKITGI